MSDSEDALRGTVGELGRVLRASGLPGPDQAASLRALADAIEDSGAPPRCTIVKPAPGRRPTDEITSPGQGSSDAGDGAPR